MRQHPPTWFAKSTGAKPATASPGFHVERPAGHGWGSRIPWPRHGPGLSREPDAPLPAMTRPSACIVFHLHRAASGTGASAAQRVPVASMPVPGGSPRSAPVGATREPGHRSPGAHGCQPDDGSHAARGDLRTPCGTIREPLERADPLEANDGLAHPTRRRRTARAASSPPRIQNPRPEVTEPASAPSPRLTSPDKKPSPRRPRPARHPRASRPRAAHLFHVKRGPANRSDPLREIHRARPPEKPNTLPPRTESAPASSQAGTRGHPQPREFPALTPPPTGPRARGRARPRGRLGWEIDPSSTPVLAA